MYTHVYIYRKLANATISWESPEAIVFFHKDESLKEKEGKREKSWLMGKD